MPVEVKPPMFIPLDASGHPEMVHVPGGGIGLPAFTNRGLLDAFRYEQDDPGAYVVIGMPRQLAMYLNGHRGFTHVVFNVRGGRGETVTRGDVIRDALEGIG